MRKKQALPVSQHGKYARAATRVFPLKKVK
jgi:hypothetical protein